MVISCSAFGCTNKWSSVTTVHFHKFPFRNEKLCKKWISALKRKNFIPTRASLVCSDHFRMEDYITKPEMMKKRLKKNAVPSIFNFPIHDYVPVEFLKQFSNLSSARKRVAKRGRKKRIENTKNKTLSDVQPTNKVINEDEFDDAFIEEMEVYENDQSDLFVNEKLIREEIEENTVIANEEDTCYLLSSMWSNRLKSLPVHCRTVVQKMIDEVFEKAEKGMLNTVSIP